jgi:hypothetical protein
LRLKNLYYYHLKSAKASQIFRVAFGYQCESVCICGSAFLVAASLRQVNLYYYHLKSAKASQIFRVAFGYQCESVCICGSAFLVAASLRQAICGFEVCNLWFGLLEARGGFGDGFVDAVVTLEIETGGA